MATMRHQSRIRRDMEVFSSILSNKCTSQEELINTATNLFPYFHNSNAEFHDYQLMAATTGVIESLIRLTLCPRHTEQLYHACLRTLGQVCFKNTTTAFIVGRDPRLIGFVKTLLADGHHHLTSDLLKDDALYVLQNAAATSPETQQLMLSNGFITDMVRVYRKPGASMSLQQQSMFFLSLLAANVDTGTVLNHPHALEVLLHAIHSTDTYTGRRPPISAVVAVSCLTRGRPVHPALEMRHDKRIFEHLLHALEASMTDGDFPPGSEVFYTKWKIMMGISNLCDSPWNCSMLLSLKLDTLLHQYITSLNSTTTDPKMMRFVLETLWKLFDERNSLKPIIYRQDNALETVMF